MIGFSPLGVAHSYSCHNSPVVVVLALPLPCHLRHILCCGFLNHDILGVKNTMYLSVFISFHIFHALFPILLPFHTTEHILETFSRCIRLNNSPFNTLMTIRVMCDDGMAYVFVIITRTRTSSRRVPIHMYKCVHSVVHSHIVYPID